MCVLVSGWNLWKNLPNFGKFFRPESNTHIRKLERIIIKLDRQNASLSSDQTCIYIYIYIYIYYGFLGLGLFFYFGHWISRRQRLTWMENGRWIKDATGMLFQAKCKIPPSPGYTFLPASTAQRLKERNKAIKVLTRRRIVFFPLPMTLLHYQCSCRWWYAPLYSLRLRLWGRWSRLQRITSTKFGAVFVLIWTGPFRIIELYIVFRSPERSSPRTPVTNVEICCLILDFPEHLTPLSAALNIT